MRQGSTELKKKRDSLESRLQVRPELQKHLFEKGFLITDKAVADLAGYPFYGNWTVYEAGNYQILVHKGASYYSVEKNGAVYFLIGHAFNPFSMVWQEESILSSLAEKSVQQLDLGNFGVKTLKPLVWGFNFLWGTLLGVLVRWIIGRLRKSNLMQREYINNYTLDRIAGTCFDFMIVAGTAAIDFNNLRGLWLPLVLVCTVGALVTFFYVLRCCRKLYPDYEYEGFFSMFGMLTGTASNGMILLREIDPRFETPAANNLVLQTIPALVFGFPVLLLMGFAPQSLGNTLITMGIMVVALLAFGLFIFRKRKNRKR